MDYDFSEEHHLGSLDPCFRAIFDRDLMRQREQSARQRLLQRLADAMTEILERNPVTR